MGKRGPAKKPTALKELRGNPGRRPLPKNEPRLQPEIPKCPAYLDGIGRYMFKSLGAILKDMRVLTKADKHALALLCDAYSEYRKARAVVIESGSTFQPMAMDRKGNPIPLDVKARPEVKIAANAWKRCSDMLRQFGLSPSSRADVKAMVGDEIDPLEEFRRKGEKLRSVKGGIK